jgi:predicted glycoside hydrolase/deacetylase ChbG (UPF0249 family)
VSENQQRFLIVNADDFGLSDGVNRGILEAAEHGIVTSASLMVRQPSAAAAAAAGNGGKLSVGLHVDLGEWVYQNEEWRPLYSVVPTDDADAVAAEIEHQLTKFRRLTGRNPTHLDSHQHVHRNEPVRSILSRLARELGVPLRECSRGIRYCGDFFGQDGEGGTLPGVLTVEGLKRILTDLPAGVTELGCHAGYGEGLMTAYRIERAAETRVLCSPQIREWLAILQIELCSFSDLSSRQRKGDFKLRSVEEEIK